MTVDLSSGHKSPLLVAITLGITICETQKARGGSVFGTLSHLENSKPQSLTSAPRELFKYVGLSCEAVAPNGSP